MINMNVLEVGSLSLAYLGDSVYELFVRTKLTNKSNAKISFDDIDKNAWDVANNNEVTLKLTVLNSDTNIKGQISLTTSQILKDNIFAYAAVVAILLIIILLIVFITKLIKGSSNKKARRRR